MHASRLLSLTVLMAAACAGPQAGGGQPVAAPPAAAVPPSGLSVEGGRRVAAICDAPRVGRHRAGQGAPVGMRVSSDGGWCAKGLTRAGRAFERGDVTDAPRHGEVRVIPGRTNTRVEYRPAPGYSGSDHFAVTLHPGASAYVFDVDVAAP